MELTELAKIEKPDAAVLNKRATASLRMIESMTISTDGDYALAGDELTGIKSAMKKLESQRTAITVPMNAALKAINDLFRGPNDLLEKAEKIIKGKMLAYDEAKRLLIADQQRRAQEQAEAERKRLADEAERAMAEANAKAAALAAEGNAAAAAAVIEKAQDTAAMNQAVAQVITAAPPAAEVAKAAGVHTTSKLEVEVTNLREFVVYIHSRPDLTHLLVPDSVRLRNYAKSLNPDASIPGVSIKRVATLAARAA